MRHGSRDDAEATGPADLLGGGESELEEPDCLQLVRPCEAPGVDRVDTTGRDQIRQYRLGRGVITGDNTVGFGPTVLAARVARTWCCTP